jgi:peptidyl-prolyl cis-trans isomerase A (cyclophilin A)/peptidyl-prolyl cis-trans isomerase B (cyclophilin B)
VIDTDQGEITVELFTERAPNTVANFLNYIDKDQYRKSVFHRVINGFMIQGGGFYQSGRLLETVIPIGNESRNELSNERGTIAMARTSHPHSATRQFFINHKDNLFLDAKNTTWGYTVFGKVTLGMDVVDRIANVETDQQDKPITPVIINSITVFKAKAVEIPLI